MTQLVESQDEQSQIIRVLDAIQQIANVTVGEFDIKRLSQQCVETLTKIINAEASSIFLLDEETKLLKIIAGAGYSSTLLKEDSKATPPLPATYKIGEGVTGTVAKGESIITKIGEKHLDRKEWQGKYDHIQFGNSQKKCLSFLGVPLKFREKVLGVLKVENKKEGDKYVNFTSQDQRLVEILASHIAAVIRNMELYEERRKMAIKAVTEVAKGIERLNEINIIDTQFDEVLQRIVDSVLRLLNAKFCHIRLIGKDNILKIEAMAGLGEWKKTDTPIGKGITGRVAETGEICRIENVKDWRNVEWKGEKYLHWKEANRYGLKAFCIMPLTVRNEQGEEKTLGTLNTYLDRERFSDIEYEMLKIFVSQAAIAISIAQDIKEKMEMQDRLAELEKMAAIGRLTAGATHGFKQPMQVIKNQIGMLKKKKNLKPYKEYLEIIDDRIYQMYEIISIFSRFSSPKIEENVGVDNLLHQILERLKIPKKIKIKISIEDGYKLNCDPGQIKQVFENLILNACEAMPDGGNLRISTSINNGKVKVIFKDEGIGIPDYAKEKVFDPFFTTKKGKGSGLGLYISQFIIQNHKGNIHFESKEGKGTTFTVELPISM